LNPGCAEYLKATQGDSIRHDVDRGVWLLFDNVRWAADQIERIRMNVTDSLRARQGIAARGGSPEKRRMELIKNENRVESILKAAVPYFPSRTTEFDKDRFLLGVPNGEYRGAIAAQAGLPRERLIVDPGFGFGWTPEQNLEILRRLAELRALGLPVLIGTSRKSTIGAVLDGAPVEERLFGTAATVALAIAGGADIVRVHDVAEMRQVARLADAVVRGWKKER